MNNLARNLIILGLALAIWGVSFLFVRDSQPDDDPARAVCYAQLDKINRAKIDWAKANHKSPLSTPTKDDLIPFFSDRKFPTCPGMGVYHINAVTNPPECSISSHTYP